MQRTQKTLKNELNKIELNNKLYICSMRKEFGKWLMDVSKYMVTALLLSSIFGDINNPIVLASVVFASASTLVAGLWLVRNKKEKED